MTLPAPRWREVGVVAGAYLAAALAGYLVSLGTGNLFVIRPAAAVAVVAMLRIGPAVWPVLAGSALLANLFFFRAEPLVVPIACAIAVGNTLHAWAASAILRRIPGFVDDFRRTADLAAFGLIAAVLTGLIPAAVGTGALALAGADMPNGPRGTFALWWTSVIFGVMLFAPVALAWRAAPIVRTWNGTRTLEAVAAFVVLGGTAAAVFAFGWRPASLVWVPVVGVALRFGMIGGSLAVCVVSACAIVFTTLGLGPLVVHGPSDIAEIQGWIAVGVCLGGILGVASDLRLRTELELRAERARYQQLVEVSPLPVMMSDLEGRVLEWNRAAERMLGWSRAEVLGTVMPHVPEELRSGMHAMLRGQAAGRSVDGVRVERLRRDGTRVLVSVHAAAVRDANGRPIASVGILQDESAREAAEAREREGAKLEAVGRLAGGVAHDFNNHMTTVLGLSDFVRDQLPEGDPLREDLLEIKRAAERAATLTRQLLAVGQRQLVTPEPLDLNAVISETVPALREQLGANVRLHLELDPTLAAVRSDREQVEQVLRIVATNAREAMPQGGRFTLQTSHGEMGAVGERIGAEAYVQLDVTDTGVGMDEESLRRLFEPFYSTKGPGRGLGLATAYGIVKRLGGIIAVSSTPGRGTSIRILLPRVDADALTATRADRPAAAPRVAPPSGAAHQNGSSPSA